jgi:hypothetical protein
MNHLVFSLELLKAEKRPVTIMAMSARMSMTVVIKGRPESKAKSKSKRGVVKAKERKNEQSDSVSIPPSGVLRQASVHTPVNVSSVEQLPDNSGTVVGVLELTLDGNTHTGSHGEVRDHGHLRSRIYCIVSGVQILTRSLRQNSHPRW